MAKGPRKLLTKQTVEFELAITGVALAALFVEPMWMEFLHNNWPDDTTFAQGAIGVVCTLAAFTILGRLIWIYWE